MRFELLLLEKKITTKTPKPTKITPKKGEGKITIHPELLKGLMSLTFFQR